MPVIGSTTPQESSTSASQPLVTGKVDVALAIGIAGALFGLALLVTVALCIMRRRIRIRKTRQSEDATRSLSKTPVEGVRTPADAWAGMATFETVMCAAAVKICVEEQQGDTEKAVSIDEKQMPASSSWVVEQDLTELWEHARRDTSQHESDGG